MQILNDLNHLVQTVGCLEVCFESSSFFSEHPVCSFMQSQTKTKENEKMHKVLF